MIHPTVPNINLKVDWRSNLTHRGVFTLSRFSFELASIFTSAHVSHKKSNLQALREPSNVFDIVFRLSNMCLKCAQEKFEVYLK